MNTQFVGTMPVQERHRFDVGALERHLRSHIEGFSGPLSVEQFKGGQSNPTYLLRAPSPARRRSCCPRRTPWSASFA